MEVGELVAVYVGRESISREAQFPGLAAECVPPDEGESLIAG
jgi:hypothetical protein